MVSDTDRSSCSQLRPPDETEAVEREFVLFMPSVSVIRKQPNSGSEAI